MIVYLFLIFSLAQNTEAKLKLKVVSVHHCKLLESQMDPDHPVSTNLTLRKVNRQTTVLNCDLDIKKYGPVKFTYRAYFMLQNGHKSLIFKMESVSCHNPITSKLVQLLKFKFEKDCIMDGGHYHFENINVETFAFFLTKSTTAPGKYSFELVFISPKGIVECFDIVGDLIETKR